MWTEGIHIGKNTRGEWSIYTYIAPCTVFPDSQTRRCRCRGVTILKGGQSKGLVREWNLDEHYRPFPEVMSIFPWSTALHWASTLTNRNKPHSIPLVTKRHTIIVNSVQLTPWVLKNILGIFWINSVGWPPRLVFSSYQQLGKTLDITRFLPDPGNSTVVRSIPFHSAD